MGQLRNVLIIVLIAAIMAIATSVLAYLIDMIPPQATQTAGVTGTGLLSMPVFKSF